jgi:hypothetical protein
MRTCHHCEGERAKAETLRSLDCTQDFACGAHGFAALNVTPAKRLKFKSARPDHCIAYASRGLTPTKWLNFSRAVTFVTYPKPGSSRNVKRYGGKPRNGSVRERRGLPSVKKGVDDPEALVTPIENPSTRKYSPTLRILVSAPATRLGLPSVRRNRGKGYACTRLARFP